MQSIISTSFITRVSAFRSLNRFGAALCLAVAGSVLLTQACGQNAEPTTFSGKVVETMGAASYTYVLVDTGEKKLWAAAPAFEVKVGDKVRIANAFAMPGYESKTLKRTFDVVYFTGNASVNEQKPTAAAHGEQPLPPGHPPLDGKHAAATIDFSKIEKPSGGKTVSEIVDGRKQVTGKEVTVRGKVVKYNGGVMGKNWLHIRDGSGTATNNDLTVTTATPVKVGDTVLVKGMVATDRNFGGGYFYAVIVEDANVTVEK